ncbi:MAG: hypothetical protein GY946_29705 [bacterium]|nr:hypothetical protein [bacterium]
MAQPLEHREPPDDRMDWLGSSAFLIMHAAVVSVFFVTGSWGLVALCLILCAVRMLGVVGGCHRYFSHRSCKLGRLPQFVMAGLAQSSAQKGVLWWELDPTYNVLKVLSWLGIVSDMRRPPVQRLEAQRIDGGKRADPVFDLINSIRQARQRAPS